MYADISTPKIVSFDQIKRAFTAAYLIPAPSDSEYKQVIHSLEAWYDEDRQTVLWGKILDAP
jgi:hypothetical protein